MKLPLVSVIVPCYQVEKYLPTCIDSILRQTYSRLEILLVDDGSPDRCGEICDAYALKDDRIKVIHKQNGGLSDARNVAIDQAKGEWITFIDSDDFVADSYVETLYGLAMEYGSDCSVCRFMSIKEGDVVDSHRVTPSKEVFSPLKAVELMFYQEKFDNNAHSKLYHRRLFESGIRYPKGLVFEDLATTYQLLLNSHSVAYTDAELYYYLLRADSIEGAYHPRKIEDGLTVLKMLDDHMDLLQGIEKAYECRKFSFVMHLLLTMPKSDRHYREMTDCIVKMRKKVLLNGHARKKARAAALISYLGMFAVKSVFSLVNCR